MPSNPTDADGSFATGLAAASTTSPERDIDVVLVTGAGASCSFGAGGQQLAQMAQWSEHLVNELARRCTGYRKMTGLHIGMGGEEFESALGKFLQDAIAFRRTAEIVKASVTLPGAVSNPHAMTDGAMAEWHRQTVHHLDQINAVLYESLYQLFADINVDNDAAANAYADLFSALNITAASRLVYATTNYDTIGEYAIQAAGRLPDWGLPPRSSAATEAPVEVAGLLNGMPRYTPVLHLHGRIGWFTREDGRVHQTDVRQYQTAYGTPLAMFPDPDKDYDQNVTIVTLWSEFRSALSRAKKVLILGHSLNDAHLVRTIGQWVSDPHRVAVVVFADANDPMKADDTVNDVIARAQLVSANTVIPMRFGGTGLAFAREAIHKWALNSDN